MKRLERPVVGPMPLSSCTLWFAQVFPQDGRTSTTVTFTKPGEYVLQALADDGALTGFQDVKVVVTP
jgi:hypothetical protein